MSRWSGYQFTEKEMGKMADGDGPHIADLPKAKVRRQKAGVTETQLEGLQHPESSLEELPAVEELELASSSEEDSAGSSKEQAAKASVPDN